MYIFISQFRETAKSDY